MYNIDKNANDSTCTCDAGRGQPATVFGNLQVVEGFFAKAKRMAPPTFLDWVSVCVHYLWNIHRWYISVEYLMTHQLARPVPNGGGVDRCDGWRVGRETPSPSDQTEGILDQRLDLQSMKGWPAMACWDKLIWQNEPEKNQALVCQNVFRYSKPSVVARYELWDRCCSFHMFSHRTRITTDSALLNFSSPEFRLHGSSNPLVDGVWFGWVEFSRSLSQQKHSWIRPWQKGMAHNYLTSINPHLARWRPILPKTGIDLPLTNRKGFCLTISLSKMQQFRLGCFEKDEDPKLSQTYSIWVHVGVTVAPWI